MTVIAVIVIAEDLLSWDEMSSNYAASNELGRSCLSALVILFDVLVITQVKLLHTYTQYNFSSMVSSHSHG